MYPIFIRELKYKSVTVYVKNKKEVCAYIIISKETFHLKYVSKKQNKLRQMKKDEKKEESYIANVIKYAFCFLVFLFLIR